MSEPQTSAKVTLNTSKGALNLELWAKEIPKSCHEVIKHSILNSFNNWTFSKITSEIVEIEYDRLYENDKDSLSASQVPKEFNSRLGFQHRGYVGLCSTSNNYSQGKIFITLKEVPSYNYKFTVIGKIVDDTIYNLVNIVDVELGEDGKPLYPARITSSVAITRYFDDLTDLGVSTNVQKTENVADKNKANKKKKSVKINFFEEDEEENEADQFQMKSAHEILKDRKLVNKKMDTTSVSSEENMEAKENDNLWKTPKTVQEELKPTHVSPMERSNATENTNFKSKVQSVQKPPPKLKRRSKQENEQLTLMLLQEFNSKLQSTSADPIIGLEDRNDSTGDNKNTNDGDGDFDDNDVSALYNHKLIFES